MDDDQEDEDKLRLLKIALSLLEIDGMGKRRV